MKTSRAEMETPRGEMETPRGEMETPRGEMESDAALLATARGERAGTGGVGAAARARAARAGNLATGEGKNGSKCDKKAVFNAFAVGNGKKETVLAFPQIPSGGRGGFAKCVGGP